MIVIEDVKVTNMSKSAAGTIATPGRSIKAKSGLNKSILDQGWLNAAPERSRNPRPLGREDVNSRT